MCRLQVPFFFKHAVDALSIDPTGATTATYLGLFPLAPVALLLGYGISRCVSSDAIGLLASWLAHCMSRGGAAAQACVLWWAVHPLNAPSCEGTLCSCLHTDWFCCLAFCPAARRRGLVPLPPPELGLPFVVRCATWCLPGCHRQSSATWASRLVWRLLFCCWAASLHTCHLYCRGGCCRLWVRQLCCCCSASSQRLCREPFSALHDRTRVPLCQVFRHLHNLDLQFHLNRQTGVTRVRARGAGRVCSWPT